MIKPRNAGVDTGRIDRPRRSTGAAPSAWLGLAQLTVIVIVVIAAVWLAT